LEAAARSTSGQVLYESLDVADTAGLEAAVARAEAGWGVALDGVVHLAGVLSPRLLGDESEESFAAALRPRVQGTLALLRLLAARPAAAFVAVSSVNGFFGDEGR